MHVCRKVSAAAVATAAAWPPYFSTTASTVPETISVSFPEYSQVLMYSHTASQKYKVTEFPSLPQLVGVFGWPLQVLTFLDVLFSPSHHPFVLLYHAAHLTHIQLIFGLPAEEYGFGFPLDPWSQPEEGEYSSNFGLLALGPFLSVAFYPARVGCPNLVAIELHVRDSWARAALVRFLVSLLGEEEEEAIIRQADSGEAIVPSKFRFSIGLL